MTYQNLLNEFIKTDKRFLEYEQGNHFVRLVKIQLKPDVYALYATITYCGKDPSYNRYHFNPRDAMELVGYIDHNGDLRFPTCHFSGIIEDAENGPQHENKKNVLESILQKEAKKMALATPLPSISDGKDEVLHTAYEEALRWVFRGETYSKEYPISDFDKYVHNPDCLVDYLAGTPGWYEKVIKKWAQNDLEWGWKIVTEYSAGEEITALEEFRQGLAYIELVKACEQRILQDRTLNLHRYVEMKNAVQEFKTATVVFRTVTGDINEVKMCTAEFDNSFHWDRLSLLEVTPRKDMERVYNLVPESNFHEYTANATKVRFINKADIVAIKHRGKVIWQQKNSPESNA